MKRSKGEGTAVASVLSLMPGVLKAIPFTAAQGRTSQCGICCSKVHGALAG